MDFSKPIKLKENRVWRIYLGGKLIDEFRSCDGEDGYYPEDWIASVVSANNPPHEGQPDREGLVMSEDGQYLKDIIDNNPVECLGSNHIEKHGKAFGVLTKFLDSAERLPAQVHPDKKAARELFNSEFGKTEAWYILGGRKINGEDPYILLGFKDDVTKEQLHELFDAQDISAMASLMHKIPVKSGDVFIIRGGTPHAIGPGCFLLEIQEPTDYTISLEKCNTKGEKLPDFLCHMGIGFDKMFDCFNYIKFSPEGVLDEFKLKPEVISFTDASTVTQLIGYDATPCFSLNRIDIKDSYTCRCEKKRPCALVCIEGSGNVNGVNIKQGESMFVPAAVEELAFSKECESFSLLQCLPPC